MSIFILYLITACGRDVLHVYEYKDLCEHAKDYYVQINNIPQEKLVCEASYLTKGHPAIWREY